MRDSRRLRYREGIYKRCTIAAYVNFGLLPVIDKRIQDCGKMDTPKISPASLPETEMEEIQEKILNLLNESGSFDSLKASNPLGLDHQKVVGGIKSLQSIGNVSSFIIAISFVTRVSFSRCFKSFFKSKS